MAERTDGGRQIRLALGASGWALGGGEYDDDGLCQYVVTDDGSGEQRRWKVSVPLQVIDGVLAVGEPEVEELADGPTCPGPDCPRCSGESCSTHGTSPCDCDSAERHA